MAYHIELAHIFGEVFTTDFQQDMVVVTHQAVVVDRDGVLFGVSAHQCFEASVIFGLMEDLSTLYAPIENMIVARNLYTRSACHGCHPL